MKEQPTRRESCETCAAFERYGEVAVPEWGHGECRRKSVGENGFPTVFLPCWCLEYEAREASK